MLTLVFEEAAGEEAQLSSGQRLQQPGLLLCLFLLEREKPDTCSESRGTSVGFSITRRESRRGRGQGLLSVAAEEGSRQTRLRKASEFEPGARRIEPRSSFVGSTFVLSVLSLTSLSSEDTEEER